MRHRLQLSPQQLSGGDEEGSEGGCEGGACHYRLVFHTFLSKLSNSTQCGEPDDRQTSHWAVCSSSFHQPAQCHSSSDRCHSLPQVSLLNHIKLFSLKRYPVLEQSMNDKKSGAAPAVWGTPEERALNNYTRFAMNNINANHYTRIIRSTGRPVGFY